MAKVVIIIEDIKDGQVKLKMEFDPVLDVKTTGTPAQRFALRLLELAKEERDTDDSDND